MTLVLLIELYINSHPARQYTDSVSPNQHSHPRSLTLEILSADQNVCIDLSAMSVAFRSDWGDRDVHADLRATLSHDNVCL